MIIRPATNKDKPILLGFEQAVITAERPFNAAIKEGEPTYYNLEELINSQHAKLLVIEIEKTVVACGYGKIQKSKSSLNHEQHIYLGFMYVEPKWRGQGLNKVVIDALMQWGKTLGIVDFYLDVYHGNNPAISAYEKLGFKHSLIEMKLSLS